MLSLTLCWLLLTGWRGWASLSCGSPARASITSLGRLVRHQGLDPTPRFLPQEVGGPRNCIPRRLRGAALLSDPEHGEEGSSSHIACTLASPGAGSSPGTRTTHSPGRLNLISWRSDPGLTSSNSPGGSNVQPKLQTAA